MLSSVWIGTTIALKVFLVVVKMYIENCTQYWIVLMSLGVRIFLFVGLSKRQLK